MVDGFLDQKAVTSVVVFLWVFLGGCWSVLWWVCLVVAGFFSWWAVHGWLMVVRGFACSRGVCLVVRGFACL